MNKISSKSSRIKVWYGSLEVWYHTIPYHTSVLLGLHICATNIPAHVIPPPPPPPPPTFPKTKNAYHQNLSMNSVTAVSFLGEELM